MRPDPSTVAPPDGGATARARGWAKIAVRVAAAAYCWALLWLLVWTVLPRLVGWAPTVIDSGSMAPLIRAGDVVLTEPDVSIEDLAPGQIVTFTDPATGRLTTHRIDAVDDDAITTKGDANRIADTTPVADTDMVGRARIIVPAVGLPRVWFSQGRLGLLLGWAALTATALWLSLWTPTGHDPRPQRRPSWPRLARPVTAAGLALLVGFAAGPTSSRAAFSALTDNTANLFTAATDFGYSLYADEVQADNPEAYWRLGEAATLPAPVFTDDFEVFTGWNQYGSGTIATTPTAHGGSAGLIKDNNNDPNGGWKALGPTLGNQWTLETWIYRPSWSSGGATDRMGIEDASFNGYSFGANHGGNNLFIDRRDGGSPSGSLASTSFDPPEDAWYRVVLSGSDGNLTVNAYDGAGAPLASVSTSDTTYTSFDRAVVHGGHTYMVDDISVWDAALGTVAVDQTAVHDSQYQGSPSLGQPRLLASGIDTAVRFDGVDDVVAVPDHAGINLARANQRTVELWYEADDTSPRQVLYEEGGGVNGMAVYLDGGRLYARAWSDGQGWSNDLEVSTPTGPAGQAHHVVAVLDATGNSLTLYVDGVSVGVATKTDGQPLAAHSGDIGIGAMRQATRFHDGNANGDGYHFAGVLDEVALYNTALPAARVAVHHAAGT